MSAVSLRPRPVPTEPAPFVLPAPRVQLIDGLRVVHVDVPGDGSVDVRLLWPRGWAHEPDGQDGITELATRVLGTSTQDHDAYEFACLLETVGASLRADAGTEATTLGIDAVEDRVEPSLDLLLGSLARPDLSARNVEQVRHEAIDARRRHVADPTRRAQEILSRAMFAGSRLGRPRTGSTTALRARTRDEVATHIEGALEGQLPTLLVTGDLGGLDTAAVIERVTAAFPHTRSTPAPTVAPGQAESEPAIVLVDRPRAAQSVLALGHRAPSRHHADHAALQLGLALLGGAFTSRLNLRLREERGFTYGARAAHVARRDSGAIVLRTAVDTASTAEALRDIDGVVSRLLVYGATQEEVDDARHALLRRTPQRVQTVRQAADTVAERLMLGLEPDELGSFEERLPAISLEQVDEALRRHLRREMTTVVVGDAQRLRDQLEQLGLGTVTVMHAATD